MVSFRLDTSTPLAAVLAELDALLPRPVDLLVVGAEARDILASQWDPSARLVATTDVDLVLAVDQWSHYSDLLASLTPFGRRGMMFTVAGVRVDILAFGGVMGDDGAIRPPWMNEPFHVGGLDGVFASATPLLLPEEWRLTCRIPTVAGLAALKLQAWTERSGTGVTKDAGDFGLTLDWYVGADDTTARLVEDGASLIRPPEFDLRAAAAQLLGRDIATLLGQREAERLLVAWDDASRAHMARLLGSRMAGGRVSRGDEARATILLDRVAEGLAEHRVPAAD